VTLHTSKSYCRAAMGSSRLLSQVGRLRGTLAHSRKLREGFRKLREDFQQQIVQSRKLWATSRQLVAHSRRQGVELRDAITGPREPILRFPHSRSQLLLPIPACAARVGISIVNIPAGRCRANAHDARRGRTSCALRQHINNLTPTKLTRRARMTRLSRRRRSSLNNRIPVVVRMQVGCARCGHSEDETYEFDMPFAKSQAMEAYEPGKCQECDGPFQMHLKRTQRRQ